MPVVPIELDTLERWFTGLENGDVDNVTESIYDEIQLIKTKAKDMQKEEAERLIQRQKEIAQMEKPLHINQLMIGMRCRFLSTVNFTGTFSDLASAEVEIMSKARTKVKVRIIEPGKRSTGQIVTVHAHNLTNI